MKKFIAVLCLALAIFTFVPNVTEVFVPANYAITEAQAAVTISAKKKTLTQGSSFTLKINGTTKTVKWSSSDKTVATVTSKGKVTAKKVGTATITGKVGKKAYKCVVTVKPVKVTAKNIKATYYDLGFEKGVVGVLKNNNKADVEVTMTVKYYNKKGKLVGTTSDSAFYLEKGRTCALNAIGPFSQKTYESLKYAKYKVSLTVENAADYKTSYVKNISYKSTKGNDCVETKVTNTGKKKIEYTRFAMLYFDKKGNCIDYILRYADVQKGGSKDTLEFYYPYDDDFNYIKPASYKLYLNDAITYDDFSS